MGGKISRANFSVILKKIECEFVNVHKKSFAVGWSNFLDVFQGSDFVVFGTVTTLFLAAFRALNINSSRFRRL